MAWNLKLTCKYHTQDKHNYCGPACAMMVLVEIGVPYTTKGFNQDHLFLMIQAQNQIQNGTWASDPVGLQSTLETLKPLTFTNHFVVYKEATEAAGSQKLIDTLLQYRVAPIVLVKYTEHWIVVCGVKTDVDPTGGPYTILGFWVNNPIKQKRHHKANDVCGSHGHGVTHHFVPYYDWQTHYFIGAEFDSAVGALQYISVCDPQKPSIPLPSRITPTHYADGVHLIPPHAVAALLRQELVRLSLIDDDYTAEFAAGRFDTAPLLVRRLDEDGGYYYLSPSIKGGAVLGFGQTNASYGYLEGVFTFEGGTTEFELDIGKVINSLIDTEVELPECNGTVQLNEDEFTVDRELVWKPCRESNSPHLAFWQIKTGPFTFYRRLDGEVFAQLTVPAFGA